MRGGSSVGTVVVLALVLVVGAFVPAVAARPMHTALPPSPLAPHAPIVIVGDANFTAANGVVSGSGSDSDPYVLSGWDIDSSAGPGIQISDTTAYFVVRSVTIHGAHTNAGIVLTGVSNGAIESSLITDNYDTIVLGGDHLRVEGNTFDNNRGGIVLATASSVLIANNTISGGAFLFAGYNPGVIVDGNQATNLSQGVLAWGMDGFRFSHNSLIGVHAWALRLIGGLRDFEISNNTLYQAAGIALELDTSQTGKVADNTIDGSEGPGIYLSGDTEVSVERNNVSGATGPGILAETPTSGYVVQAADLRLIGNNVSGNAGGIHLNNVHRATVSGNLFTGSGLEITGLEMLDFSSHTIPDDNVNRGIPIRYRANAEGLTLDGLAASQLILANVSDSTAANLTQPYGGFPALVVGGHNLEIQDLDLSATAGTALSMRWTADSAIRRVHVESLGDLGADLSNVANVTVSNSSFTGRVAALFLGTTDRVSVRDSFFVGSGNGTVIGSSTDFEVVDSEFVDNFNGLVVSSGNFGLVDHNRFSTRVASGAAIMLLWPQFITVSRNNVSGFTYGIRLQSTGYSFIYHNAFWANAIQASDTSGYSNIWNDTYPSGGNFWGDYAGIDLCSGANQDVCAGPDGIGDTPYSIVGWVLDYYPLMRPYGTPPEPPRPDYTLYGSALAGWGFSPGNLSNPGPTLQATNGTPLLLSLNSVDGLAHTWFLDLNNNSLPDAGEPISDAFDAGHPVNFTFTPSQVGTFPYRCSLHPVSMWGMLVIASAVPHTDAYLNGDLGQNGWYVSEVSVSLVAGPDGPIPWETHYRIGGGAWVTYQVPIPLTQPGVHLVEYYSDGSEGAPEPVQSLTVRIDLIGPRFNYTLDGATGENGWYVGPVHISVVGVDSVALPVALDCRLDGSVTNPCGPFDFVTEGSHTISLNATDTAGLNYRLVLTVGIDTTPPSTEFLLLGGDSGPDGWWVSGVLVGFGTTDLGSGIQGTWWRADGGTWALQIEPIVVTDGVHVIEFYSKDVAGNVEPVQSETLYVDTDPPEVTPTVSGLEGHAGWSRIGTAVILNATDSASGVVSVLYALDSEPALHAYTGPVLLPDGIHRVTYRARDLVGHDTWGNLTVRVDSIAPTIQVAGWSPVMGSSTLRLSWIGTDATSGILGYTVSVDDGPWTSAATDLTLTLADGPHTVLVHADDVAGNGATVKVEFRIDTNPLSPSGPYGPWLLVGIVAAGFGVGLVAVLLLVRRRKRLS